MHEIACEYTKTYQRACSSELGEICFALSHWIGCLQSWNQQQTHRSDIIHLNSPRSAVPKNQCLYRAFQRIALQPGGQSEFRLHMIGDNIDNFLLHPNEIVSERDAGQVEVHVEDQIAALPLNARCLPMQQVTVASQSYAPCGPINFARSKFWTPPLPPPSLSESAEQFYYFQLYTNFVDHGPCRDMTSVQKVHILTCCHTCC